MDLGGARSRDGDPMGNKMKLEYLKSIEYHKSKKG